MIELFLLIANNLHQYSSAKEKSKKMIHKLRHRKQNTPIKTHHGPRL